MAAMPVPPMFRNLLKTFKGATAATATTAAAARALGNEALGQGRLDEAAGHYVRAMEADAADPLARVNLGYVRLEQGRFAEAEAVLGEAVQRAGAEPQALADASYLLARARLAQGRGADAVEPLRAALAARPGFVEATQELVPLLLAQGRVEEALQDVGAVLAAHPAHPGALETRGNLLLEAGRPQEALAAFEHLIAAHGRSPDALANASAALLRLDRPAEALALAEEALRFDGRHRVSLHNRVHALLDLARVEEARAHVVAALEIHPGDPDLQWNSGVAHLLLGDLAAGWRAHEARWNIKGFVRAAGTAAAPDVPHWSGEDLSGASILLYAEQGMGDSLQFLRYVPLVARRAREVVLQLPRVLAPLAQGLAPGCRVLAEGEPVPAVDWQCPLLSLPHAFGTTLADIPAHVPYLQAEPARVAAWRERLPAGAGPRVGITWSGNPHHGNDRNRSVPLAQFRRIAVEGVRFVALQPQVRDADRAALAAWPDLFDAGPELRSFADTAALMEVLDLVIAVDTSVAHLAGALARPTWILLPHAPDWRWMVGRDDTPWYPSARLYRQPKAGDWDGVLERVRADLRALA